MNLNRIFLILIGAIIIILICNCLYLIIIKNKRILILTEQRYEIESYYNQNKNGLNKGDKSIIEFFIKKIEAVYLDINNIAPLNYKYLIDQNIDIERYFSYFQLVMTNEEQNISNTTELQLGNLLFNIFIFCFLFIILIVSAFVKNFFKKKQLPFMGEKSHPPE